MIDVLILGAGNLGYHLTKQLLNSTAINLVQVYNRSITKINYLKKTVPITNKLSDLKEADIYILCVSDNAISELSKQINFSNKLVIHTSGATTLHQIKSTKNKGVLYFPQSFSKAKKIDFSKIPVCIEASSKTSLSLLKKLAIEFSTQYYVIDSEQRKQLHLAAVFANNFVNHLLHNAALICENNHIPFKILTPIIKETFEKIEKMSPFDAQTGPAKRNDTNTIINHQKLLNGIPLNIYTLLTQSIQETYGKKL
jgi:predicted short-subunit dehydrogenase-like oxidoreductase (DUF2520 family)